MKDDTLGFYSTHDLREAARRRLPHGLFEFMDRGNDDEVAMRHNRAALEAIRFKPRVLVDVSKRSPEITLMGKKQALPIKQQADKSVQDTLEKIGRTTLPTINLRIGWIL